jgi:hypothetical protein
MIVMNTSSNNLKMERPFLPAAGRPPPLTRAERIWNLSHWQPQVIYVATIVVLTFGSIGVLRALFKGLDMECACMGTGLHVPLSTVALIEDLGMALMAAVMLWTAG